MSTVSNVDNKAGGVPAGLVSVIIPVKGGGAAIGAALSDIAAQTWPAIELIVVGPAEDDGTDAAVEAAFAALPERTGLKKTYIGRAGEGVSAGRNAGIEAANGEVLVFFDGDDRIDPACISYLMEGLRGVDLSVCGYDLYTEEDSADIPGLSSGRGHAEALYRTPETQARVLSAPDMACRLFFETHYQGYVWNKAFRADIIRDCGIRFREDLYYNEDRTFLVDYLTHAGNVRMAPAPLYHYIAHADSATGVYERQRQEEGPVDDALFERRLTELAGFTYMLKALGKDRRYDDARYFCGQSFGACLFSYFFEVATDRPEEAYAFRKSALRKYGRRLGRYVSRPDDPESRAVYRAFKRYGFTGNAYFPQEED